jgi:exopolysaccharide biosynthesis protein
MSLCSSGSKKILGLIAFLIPFSLAAQIKWKNVDSVYEPLPKSIHVYFTDDPIDTGTFRAFYLVADLKSKKLDFTTDTTSKRRLTPFQFYEKNARPLVVANGTFFSFETNRNLNLVMKDGKLLSYNVHSIAGRGKDTLTYKHVFGSAIGITKRRKADVAWLYTDSSQSYPLASQHALKYIKDSTLITGDDLTRQAIIDNGGTSDTWFEHWKMKTAIGGGPVLLQNGEIKISNEEEQKFTGKAIKDKHPRTAMGYTRDNKLIILVVEGRNPKAGGATLTQEAQILKDLGCVEALNLDGGGSSCLLINGKETIKPSDKEGQRAVPAVFIIRQRD